MNSKQSKALGVTGLDILPFRQREVGECELQIVVESRETFRTRTTSIRLSKRDLANLAFQILFELRDTCESGSAASFHAGRVHSQLLEQEKAAREASKASEEMTS